MKPNFALSLTFDGIGLLQRAAGGWRRVGDVALDDPKMMNGLAALREKAQALAPEGITTKLLLPNAQIKYLTIDTPGADSAARRAAAIAALDGATPYPVADLALDISEEGERTHIAAVARETLSEAEAFATENGFNPVSFAAVPGAQDFLGEPFFGATASSTNPVEPDGIAVVVVGDAQPPEPVQAPPPEPPAPAVPEAPQPAIGFASRRAAGGKPAPQLGGVTRVPPAAAPPPPPETPQWDAGTITAGEIALEPEAAPAPPPPKPAGRGLLGLRRAAPAAAPEPVLAAAAPVETMAAAPPPPAQPTADADTERERMTVFGARRSEIGGKPRFLGLILTAALLVFLAGVAAWASVFLDEDNRLSRLFAPRAPEPTFSEPLPTPPAPLAVTQAPEAPEVIVASLDPTLSDEDAAVLDALRDPDIATPDPQPDLEELQASYAATGIWPRAPEVPPAPANPLSLDSLYLTSIDPISTASDAIALPAPDTFDSDLVLASIASPPAADTVFNLDTAGRVIPTTQGAITPDGFTVFLGRPPLVPPPTPTRFQSEPIDDAPRTALAGFRPEPRPADLVDQAERARFGGLTRSELAEQRPVLRPPSVQEQAAAVAEAAAIATAQEDAAATEATDGAVALALSTPAATGPVLYNPTRNAAAASLRPDVRPHNFARTVQRAQRNTERQDEVRVASAAATIAPRTVTPSIPTRTSVATQATVRNAINLRKINLIGVYGKPSNRRALVRLGNGRYQKVVVGDRVDGGRVSAIGNSELRYTKRGRDIVLRMPQ